MGEEIDRLEVQVEAQASDANKQLDKLVNTLGKVSSAMSSVNSDGLSNLSNGVLGFTKAVQQIQGNTSSKLVELKKGISAISRIKFQNSSGLTSSANAISSLTISMKSLQGAKIDTGSVTRMANSIARLQGTMSAPINTDGYNQLGSSLSDMIGKLASVEDVSPRVSSITGSIARLASSGDKASVVAAGLPLLSRELNQLLRSLSAAPQIAEETVQITSAIARLASAGSRTKVTADNLEYLSQHLIIFIQRLQTAPQVAASTTQLVSAIGNIAIAGKSANGALNNFAKGSGTKSINVVKSLTNGFKALRSQMTGFNKTSKGLASSFGMFYAKFFMVIRAVKSLGRAIGSAQDYIEEFNYFSVALNKVGQDSADEFKKAGYNSAEAYADSFKTRFATLQKQMTGYTVDYDTGNATSGIAHNLGLNLTDVMNYNAAISQITNSAGMLGETSIATSKALSMLSADWSSLSNQNLSDVMNNFQSGIVGQSRALYKYGIDITSAGLAQTAFNHGLDISIKDLSQQSKMQLRVLTMLEQSKVAYGDLARTINQPANQLRMLQTGFKNLARTIGSLFMPVIQKLYPYLNAIVLVLQEFAQWIAKVAGINLAGDDSGSISLPDYETAADDVDDYADNTKKAAKAQKKLNDNIQGFDVLNKLSDNSDSNDDDKDDTPKNSIDLSDDISKALAGYEKVWNEAFKNNQNKAVKLAKKIKKAFLNAWNKGGDFTSIGSSFAKWVNKGLRKIPWDGIKNNVKKVAKSIATFLNGFIKDLDWKLVGKTIAEGLNTGLEFLYTFLTTFDFLKFGESIGEGLNSAIKNFDWKLLGKTLGAKLRGIVQFAFGLVTSFDFTQFGKKIGEAINGFFEDMGKVDKRTGLTGWQEMGKTISDSVKGILDTITTALGEVNWNEVGKAIGQFLGQLDWIGIIGKTGQVIGNALFAALKIAISAFAEDPAGVITTLGIAFSGIFAYKNIKNILNPFKKNSSLAMSDSLVEATKAIKTENLKELLGTKLGKIGTIAIALTVAVQSFKWASNNWKEVFGKYSQDEISSALQEMFKDAFSSIPGKLGTWFLTGGIFGELADKITEAITGKGFKERLAEGVAGVFEGLGTLFSQKFSLDEWVNGFKEAFSDAGNEIQKGSSEFQKDVEHGLYLKEQYEKGNTKNLMSKEEYFKAKKEKQLAKEEAKRAAASKKALEDATPSKSEIEKTNAYQSAMSKLAKTMDNLGVPTQQQSEYMRVLKRALENGSISTKEFTKLANNQKLSTKELAKAIGEIKSKSVKVDVKTNGAGDVETVKKNVDDLRDKDVQLRIKEATENGSPSDIAEAYRAALNSIPAEKTVKVGVEADTSDINEIKDKIKGIKPKTFQIPMQFGITQAQLNILNRFKPGGDNKMFDDMLKKSGLATAYDMFKNVPVIKGYATGGYPASGEMFIAHENGLPEMVGKIGNHAAVANNVQITDAISKAVGEATYAAVKSAMSDSGNSTEPEIVIKLDGRTIAKSTINEVRKIKQSTGRNPVVQF